MSLADCVINDENKVKEEEMMKKLVLILALTLIVLCGCSYKTFEDNFSKDDGVDSYVSEDKFFNSETTSSTNDNEVVFHEELKYSSDDILYVGIGDEFKDWNEITDPSMLHYPICGYEGLVYTVTEVKVYETFVETRIPEEETIQSTLDGCQEYFGEDNIYYVIIDITAKYNNLTNSSDSDTIYPFFSWKAVSRSDSEYEYYESFPNGSFCRPMSFYFSEHLKEDRTNPISGEKLTVLTDYFWFESPLSDGQKIDFQIGIIVDKWLIERKNLFLTVHGVPQPWEAEPQIYVDVLGRFANDEK